MWWYNRISFAKWNVSIDSHWIRNRVRWCGLWTPFVVLEKRQDFVSVLRRNRVMDVPFKREDMGL